MKAFAIFIIIIGLFPVCNGQTVEITIGRGTNCFGRGTCSISTNRIKQFNASFLVANDGGLILRIHRNLLTQSEENRLLEEPIEPSNQNRLLLQLDDYLPFPESVQVLTAHHNSEYLSGLTPGRYRTGITEAFIDVILRE